MPAKMLVLAIERLVRSRHPLLERLDDRREQGVQVERGSLGPAERRALVRNRILQERHAPSA